MYNIAIVDDDIIFRHRLSTRINLLKDLLSIQTVYLYDDLISLQSTSILMSVQILFVNIKIAKQNGLDCVWNLRRLNPNIVVMFIAEFDSFIKVSCGTNVYGYLLKEKLDEMLEPTIRSAIKVVEDCDETIILKTRGGVVILKQMHIKLIAYEKRHPVVYTETKCYTVLNQSLTGLERYLNDRMFIRANHGNIVNLKYLEQLTTKELRIINFEESIVVARGRYSKILAKLRTYRGYF